MLRINDVGLAYPRIAGLRKNLVRSRRMQSNPYQCTLPFAMAPKRILVIAGSDSSGGAYACMFPLYISHTTDRYTIVG
jgi:hypothetical protein